MKKKILLRTKAHFSHFGTVLTSKEYSSDTDLLLSSETVQRRYNRKPQGCEADRHMKCTNIWPCIRGVQDSQSFLLSIQRYNEIKLALYIKTILVASKMNHVCYEHFLIRPAYETAPTDQQEFSHINLISNTICSLKLTIFYLIMTRPCQPGYYKINTSNFFQNLSLFAK